MPDLTEYLLKLSLSLALVYVFYLALLRTLTFYHWNRFFLAGLSLAAFLIPFIDITPWIPSREESARRLLHAIPQVSISIPAEDQQSLFPFKISYVLIIVFAAGIMLRLFQLTRQWLSLQNIKNKGVLSKVDKINLYDVDGNISPFSFAGSVYINSRLHTREELEKIIAHEFVHVKQKHTADLMIAEFICIINWFNPFAWLIRKAIRQNLEFIADHTVLEAGLDARQYQYLLLKVVGVPRYSLTNNFNFSSLKKRIAMINKNRSSAINLIKFLLIIPLLVLVLLAFRHRSSAHPQPSPKPSVKKGVGTAPVIAAAPRQKANPASASPRSTAPGKPVKRKAMYDRSAHESADTIPVEPTAPPEPPVAPLPPAYNTNANKNVNPVAPPAAPSTGLVAPALPSKVDPVAGPVLPKGVKGFHQENNLVTVTLENGKKEVYNLDKPDEKSAFEKKYGAMPNPPKPPLRPVKA